MKDRRELEPFRGKPTVSADGTSYGLLCSINKPDDAVRVLESDCEGVGLFHSEWLFMGKTSVPTEEEQFKAYQKAALILKDKPLYIRTLDIIGENEMPSLCLANEPNPLMGFRAIRYTLKHRDLFKTQLRAILRASAFGQIRIMFPLISCVEEVREGKALVEACKAELAAEQLAFDANIKVGIMTETAASGIMADRLAKECDFFTIGTDDLISYTLSADRNSGETAYLCSVYQPSVLRIIKNIIEAANRCHIPVSMCGEAAADPKIIPLLISFGLTDFTVAAASVLRVRKCIAGWTKAKADEIAEKVMTFSTQKEVENFLLNQILP